MRAKWTLAPAGSMLGYQRSTTMLTLGMMIPSRVSALMPHSHFRSRQLAPHFIRSRVSMLVIATSRRRRSDLVRSRLPRNEQLCSGGEFSGVEMIAHGGIEDGGELAHAGDEGDLCRLSVVAQATVELLDGRVVTDCAEGGEVEDVSDLHAAAGDGAIAAALAAVVIDRGDSDQGSGLMAGQAAEFAHVGDERPGQHRPDTFEGDEAGEERGLGAVTGDDRGHLALDLLEFGAQRGQAPRGTA